MMLLIVSMQDFRADNFAVTVREITVTFWASNPDQYSIILTFWLD